MKNGWPLSTRIKTRLSRLRRSIVKRRFANLFDEISSTLFKYDPIGINFEDNGDEYDPEAGTILPRLSQCHSPSDVRRVVFEEFCKWFGPETAGDEMKYDRASADIWALWCAHQLNTSFRR
jgi:hypothetical protein